MSFGLRLTENPVDEGQPFFWGGRTGNWASDCYLVDRTEVIEQAPLSAGEGTMREQYPKRLLDI
jgi:hypothetical protein